MAIEIGSNFSYNGKQFLDYRQNKFKTIEDLESCNTPMPDGFEVFVEGQWYIYDSKISNGNLGHFIPRLSQDLGESDKLAVSQKLFTDKYAELDAKIFELMSTVFPLSAELISGGGNFEMGSMITPKITWRVTRRGEEVNNLGVTVNGSTEGVWEDKKGFSTDNISETTSYLINIISDGLLAKLVVDYVFKFGRYWGASDEAEIVDNSFISEFHNSLLGNDHTMSFTIDCLNNYPYYIIPSSEWSDGATVQINGEQSDYEVTELEFPNAYGVTCKYAVVKLSKEPKTGTLNIEIK